MRFPPAVFVTLACSSFAACGSTEDDLGDLRTACNDEECGEAEDERDAGSEAAPEQMVPCPDTDTANRRATPLRQAGARGAPAASGGTPLPPANPVTPQPLPPTDSNPGEVPIQAPGQGPLAPACGDGVLYGEEACDDGNRQGLDGCDSLCSLERGFTCEQPGMPCVSDNVCGDGIAILLEECDDGNTNGVDGCSSTCGVETGYRCPQPGRACEPLCGDGLVVGSEACDDGNGLGGDGCSELCDVELGYQCVIGLEAASPPAPLGAGGMSSAVGQAGASAEPPSGELPIEALASVCSASVCGNSIVENGEACDVGHIVDEDCTEDCVAAADCMDGICVTRCGDGLLTAEGSEECDDENFTEGDGCDQFCRVEPGFSCGVEPGTETPATDTAPASLGRTQCSAICGDGVRVYGEACDDGGMNGAGYGFCGAACSFGPRCGDTVVDPGVEQCDNGQNSATYYTEEGDCAPSCLNPAFCGDGIVDPLQGEDCDLGERNTGAYGTCGPSCLLASRCGDGLLDAPYEQCDDGNLRAGDGCAPNCGLESDAPPDISEPEPPAGPEPTSEPEDTQVDVPVPVDDVFVPPAPAASTPRPDPCR